MLTTVKRWRDRVAVLQVSNTDEIIWIQRTCRKMSVKSRLPEDKLEKEKGNLLSVSISERYQWAVFHGCKRIESNGRELSLADEHWVLRPVILVCICCVKYSKCEVHVILMHLCCAYYSFTNRSSSFCLLACGIRFLISEVDVNLVLIIVCFSDYPRYFATLRNEILTWSMLLLLHM